MRVLLALGVKKDPGLKQFIKPPGPVYSEIMFSLKLFILTLYVSNVNL